MKKVALLIFVVKMIIISSYSFTFTSGYIMDTLISRGSSLLLLNFNSADEYDFFLELARNNELTVFQLREFLINTHIIIRTDDISLGGWAKLVEGRWPAENSDEFISDAVSGRENQSGLIRSIVPGYIVEVSPLIAPNSYPFKSLYRINTSDPVIIEQFMHELNENIRRAEISDIREQSVGILSGVFGLWHSEAFEILGVILLLLMLGVLCMVQYSIERLKPSTIFMLHGFSKVRIIAANISSIAKPFFVICTAVLACTFLIIALAGYSHGLPFIVPYMLLICVCFFVVYTVVISVTTQLYLWVIGTKDILKGKKPYKLIQTTNLAFKLAFFVFALTSLYFAAQSYNDLRDRLEHISVWDIARGVYKTHAFSIGQYSNLELDLEISQRVSRLYDDLSLSASGFIMDAGNIFITDDWYFDGDISSQGNRVDISPNYLLFNPITAVNGIPIEQQLVRDASTLNLLVPNSLRPYHDEIVRVYTEEFYFRQVYVDNHYNRVLGLPRNTTSIEDLSIHIIYVEDGQYYFTFTPFVRTQYGNKALDPIAVVYTGNIHPSFISSYFTRVFYFQTDAEDVHRYILPLLEKHDLVGIIDVSSSIRGQVDWVVSVIRRQFVSMTVFCMVLLIGNLAVTYAIVQSYFEQNKLKLFVKNTMGHGAFRRSRWLFSLLVIYQGAAALLAGAVFGLLIFALGMLVLAVDVMVAVIAERRLLNKSYKILKKGV